MPVARGSRLPTCPAFSASSMRFTRWSAEFDESPSGLSRSRIPVSMWGLLRRLVDQLGELRGFLERIVELELEARRVPQAQAAADFAAQEAGGAGEAFMHVSR